MNTAADALWSDAPELSEAVALCDALLSPLEGVSSVEQAVDFAEQFEPPHALAHFCEQLGLDGVTAFCALLSLCCEVDGRLRNRVQALTGLPVPTLDLALGLYAQVYPFERPAALMALADPAQSPLRLAFEFEAPTRPLLFLPLSLRHEALGALLGGLLSTLPPLELWVDTHTDWLPVQQPVLTQLTRHCCDPTLGEHCYTLLCGTPGSGRRTLLCRAVAALGLPCLTLSCGGLSSLTTVELTALSRRIGLLCRLTRGPLCLLDCRAELQSLLSPLLRELPPCHPLVLICDSADPLPPSLNGRAALRLTVGRLESADLATALAVLWGENPPTLEGHRLTIGQLLAAWPNALERSGTPAPPALSDLVEVLREQNPPARLVEPLPARKLSELVLEGATQERLALAARLIARCHRADGPARGTTVLLHGPSGTGKTLAAAALAGQTGLELLRIDLSRMLDKYLGETEKHLSEVFSEARERRCILFFDEADALFSRRTDISSSHDRYANVETAHLLQIIERHNGPVLLATNLFKNIDVAFLRRIDLLIRFPLPDEALRRTLWSDALPNGITFSTEIDLNALAKDLALSPASICAVGHNAVLLLQEQEREVSPSLLRLLLSNELEKMGQALDPLLL